MGDQTLLVDYVGTKSTNQKHGSLIPKCEGKRGTKNYLLNNFVI